MKIILVAMKSIAADLGIATGDDLLEINGKRINDGIDLRFYEGDSTVSLKIARDGVVTIFDIEKDDGDPLGIELEELKTLACGNDCIFCFVDQNPEGLRKALYFRDGDYRLSFMYGNYTTMTNAGPAILKRIIDQRLSPQYISVHVTDYEIRKKLMGLKKDDFILEKIRLLHDNRIDMHTQIVLCPGINDGETLSKTVHDLYQFHQQVVSLAIVPVGLTDHRFGLASLRKIDGEYARGLLERVDCWGEKFYAEIGRRFVYPSDEFFILAGRPIPPGTYYDSFPQIENGVGLVRTFLHNFQHQSKGFPKRVSRPLTLTLATGDLAAGFIREVLVPRLEAIGHLRVRLEVIPNLLYGRSVTVAGLLSGKCLYSALHGKEPGDLLLLPPDILNEDGLFLDDSTPQQLGERLGVRTIVFQGNWSTVFTSLNHIAKEQKPQPLVPSPGSPIPSASSTRGQ